MDSDQDINDVYIAADSIDLSAQSYSNMSVGTISLGDTISISPTGSPYVISDSTITNSWVFPETNMSGKMTLNGPNADIEVNGWSLMDAIKQIQERLVLLQPNPELEAEWDQLRELGDRYRELEQQLKEKSEVWAKLKQMPPPEIK